MPLNSIQRVLKRFLPEEVFNRLYQKACNAYDVYIHVVDYIYYRLPDARLDFRQAKEWLKEVQPYTMTSREGLIHTLVTVNKAVEDKIPGAFVECGVARGGCSALMALVAQTEGNRRKTWLFDSFEGLPPQSELDGEQKPVRHKNREANDLAPGYCYGSWDKVYCLLYGKLKLNPDLVLMIKGWFQDTLPEYKTQVGPIAVLRLDGDWYESTKCCLENLYDQVHPGGFIIIDDYQLVGCKLAVDQFILRQGCDRVMTETFDQDGRLYWRKPEKSS